MQSGSRSFGEKLSTLVNPSLSTHALSRTQGLGLTGTVDEGTLVSDIAPRLWQYLQRTIRQKPATCLQSFVATDSSAASPVESEQWLGELLRPSWDDLKTQPGGVGPTGDEASVIHHIRKGHSAPQTTFDKVSFPQKAPNIMTSFDNCAKTADDEMLLEDTIVKPLVLATCPGDKLL